MIKLQYKQQKQFDYLFHATVLPTGDLDSIIRTASSLNLSSADEVGHTSEDEIILITLILHFP